MQNRNLTLLRIAKQQNKLKLDPLPNVWISRDGTFDFHFVLFDLDAPYNEGYYHGVIRLHQNYPFAAPKLIFFTPTGRFLVDTPICTTFTNYHPQTWSSAWNVKSMILATISFMLGDQMGYGCISSSNNEKKEFAKNSLSFNLKNETFKRLFESKLQQKNLLIEEDIIYRDENNNQLSERFQQNRENRPGRQNQNWIRWIAIGSAIVVCSVAAYLIFA